GSSAPRSGRAPARPPRCCGRAIASGGPARSAGPAPRARRDPGLDPSPPTEPRADGLDGARPRTSVGERQLAAEGAHSNSPPTAAFSSQELICCFGAPRPGLVVGEVGLGLVHPLVDDRG